MERTYKKMATCEKCGAKTKKTCDVLGRLAYWCGCGNGKPKRGGKRSGAGRPVTDAGTLPARQFGRVNDADWQTLQEAFAGVGFVKWALPTLLAKAMREKRKAQQ